MVSSTPQAIACILLSFVVAAYTQAQTSAGKDQTASISGKVTVKDKGVAGIVVVMTEASYSGGRQRTRYRGTTDDEGNYRISKIPAGNYLAFPLTPALVVEKAQSQRSLVIAAGEVIRDVDFAMVRGGVITGRITNSDGQPLVEEAVNVMPVEEQQEFNRYPFVPIQTDDRGIYRAFGLRQGKYRVSVGEPARGLPGYTRQMYRQTFYPSVTEAEKATVIEVNEGSEINNIDIVAFGSISTFTVSGQVIDGETGKPVPRVMFAVEQTEGSSTVSSTGGVGTNSNGEFRLQNVMPGKYTLYIAAPENSDVRSDPLTFNVVDRDLTGLEIKTTKGASLSGIVVLEGDAQKSVIPSGLHVVAWIEHSAEQQRAGSRSAPVSPDGTFKLGGLPPGITHIAFSVHNQRDLRKFEILRVEHNGVPQPGGITLKEGEQVAGVRVIAKYFKLTGAIRGQVKIEDGELPPTARISVWGRPVDENTARRSFSAPEVDSRGHFLIEGLAAGTYELSATLFQPGQRVSYDITKQSVTVTDNAVTEVTVTLKLKP